ncbi:hypothetical protein MA16_Dca013179 [Dendrobium catenatum]|uniref:Uncharacterized protein n=1 Tax=Dendrobium catenatum TaxID=906689 RepID=A0A2I0WR26_9ASPA|nr:hypothetical protein MA16_Dca013179 [Dendrobium catenatum]
MVVCGASDPGFLDGASKSRSFLQALAGSSLGKFPDLIRGVSAFQALEVGNGLCEGDLVENNVVLSPVGLDCNVCPIALSSIPLGHGNLAVLFVVDCGESSDPLCNGCDTISELAVIPTAYFDLPDAASLVQCDAEVGDEGLDILVTWPLSEGDEPLSKSIADPVFTVPITIISRELLQHHLSRDSVVLHGEQILDISDDDGSFFGEDLDSRENYDLSIIQIGDEGFNKKSGKRKKRNSNKK